LLLHHPKYQFEFQGILGQKLLYIHLDFETPKKHHNRLKEVDKFCKIMFLGKISLEYRNSCTVFLIGHYDQMELSFKYGFS
ncbi:MAG: hypothetical protein IJW35_07675, partial [Lentisphaeria bacterium]|nr:hypothetical protein [Lentisphaeria bacterium]